MRYIYKVFLFLIFSSFASCSQEHLIGENPSADGEVMLKIPVTRGGGGPENGIKNTRLVVFRSYADGSRGGELLINKSKSESDPAYNEFSELVPVGLLDIYLIANELTGWNLNGITTEQELKDKILSFSDYPTVDDSHPIPMFGKYERVRITKEGNTSINGVAVNLNNPNGTVERLYAKVTLNLSCLFSDPGNKGLDQAITLDNVYIGRLPVNSWLDPAQYSPENGFFDGAGAALDGINYTSSGFNGVLTFYVPEHIVKDKDSYSYVSILAHPDSNPFYKLRYRLIIGDGIGTKGIAEMSNSTVLNDFNITRNHHYIFTTRIVSYGENDGLEVVAKVEEWETEDVDSDITERQLTVSAISVLATNYAAGRIYFWSNQPVVSVDNTGYLGTSGTSQFTVNSRFVNLAGTTASNFHYDSALGYGYMDILPNVYGCSDPKIYRIYLNAGGLKREITVTTDYYSITMKFARSNIVIGTDGNPVFATDSNDEIKATAQGLLFKWGSLVGLKGTGSQTYDADEHIAFRPSEFSGDLSGTNAVGWEKIPYISAAGVYNTARDEFKGIYNTAGSVGFDAASGKGDICRYISSKGWVEGSWRMPTSMELKELYDELYQIFDNKGVLFGLYAGSLDAPTLGSIFFPCTGYRYGIQPTNPAGLDYGSLNMVGYGGYYWSSSPYDATKAYYMSFTSNVFPQMNNPRKYGFSVRCVRDE